MTSPITIMFHFPNNLVVYGFVHCIIVACAGIFESIHRMYTFRAVGTRVTGVLFPLLPPESLSGFAGKQSPLKSLGLLLTSNPPGFSDLPTALHIVMLLSRKGFLDIRILDRVLGSEGCIIILEWLLRNHCLSLLSREKSLVKPASR